MVIAVVRKRCVRFIMKNTQTLTHKHALTSMKREGNDYLGERDDRKMR